MPNSKLNVLKKLTLLLVEDDDELRNSLRDTLEVFFEDIITAKNGEEAFEIYSTSGVDLILTDFVMPIMNGSELCKKIRVNDRKTPITIISNYSDREKLLQAVSLGLTEYLVKPIEYRQLIDTLLDMASKIEEKDVSYFVIDDSKKYSYFSKEIIDEQNNTTTKLSKSEVLILELLIENINKIVSIQNIEYTLSPNEPKSEQAIKNIIHRLRTKLTKNYIHNIQSMGYIYKSEN